MGSWHSPCGTTHCRAGWVVTLAEKAGKELEEKLGTAVAALTIYNESSDLKVHMPDFFSSNDKALADIKRLAELEKLTNEEGRND